MPTITVPTNGATVANVTLNDTLAAPAGTDLNGSPLFYEVDGNSTLQSLFIGYDIELIVGFSASGSLTGTGNITGPTDPAGGNLPLIDNYGTLDINGTIGTSLSNEGQLTVSSGERLNLIGDLFSLSGSISVAGSGELDLASPNSAFISQLTLAGTLKSATTNATLQQTANTGTIDVTAGTLALASSVTGTGTIIVESGATLNMAAAQSVSNNVVLSPGSTLRIAQTTVFTGTLQSPASATIDLINLAATGAAVANGHILITTGSGTISLGETGLAQGLALPFVSDGTGGTLISLPAATSTPIPTPTPTPTPTGSGTSPGQATLPVYRFFDRVHGTHFFTADANERDATAAMTGAYTEETNGFGAATPSDPNAVAVYRFFDTKFGTHFFTASAAERDSVEAARPDLTYEPSSTFYEHGTQQAGDVAVYRLFDQSSGTHFYTGDQAEYNNITGPGTSTYRADLKPEGIEFYAPAGSFT